MKSIVLKFFTFLVCFPALSQAANIYGSLWLDGKPVQGAQIEITCTDGHSGQTDSDGSYRIFVQERGRCIFRVEWQGQSGQTEIASYDNPIKYDFDLERQKSGNLGLRRR